MKKALIIIGDAAETVDTLYPFYRLQEDDITPVAYLLLAGLSKPRSAETAKLQGELAAAERVASRT